MASHRLLSRINTTLGESCGGKIGFQNLDSSLMTRRNVRLDLMQDRKTAFLVQAMSKAYATCGKDGGISYSFPSSKAND